MIDSLFNSQCLEDVKGDRVRGPEEPPVVGLRIHIDQAVGIQQFAEQQWITVNIPELGTLKERRPTG